jgi:hypothetical protein
VSANPACWLNSDWYRVKWNLAAQHTNAILDPEVEDAEHPELALEHSRGLVEAAAKTTRALRRPWIDQRYRDLSRFLPNTVEPAGVILLAGVLVATQSSDERPAGADVKDRNALIKLLDNPSASLAPGPLVRYALSSERTTYRVSYNAACYLSMLLLYGQYHRGTAESFSEWAHPGSEDPAARGLRMLENALRNAPPGKRAELAGWACDDPSLKPLREEREARFYALTEEREVEPRHLTFGARKRPRLDLLLEAKEQEQWDMTTVLELWAHGVEQAKKNPKEWSTVTEADDWVTKLDDLAEEEG